MSTMTIQPTNHFSNTFEAEEELKVNNQKFPVNDFSEIEQESVMNNPAAYLEHNLNLIDEELKLPVEQRDHLKLYTMITRAIALFSRISAKLDQEYAADMALKLQAKAQEIKDSFESLTGKACTWLSVGISVAAAAASFSVFVPATVMAVETATKLAGSANALSGVATGVNSVGGTFTTSQEGVKNFRMTMFQEETTKTNNTTARRQSTEQSLRTSMENINDSSRKAHEAASAILRTN